MRVEKELMRGAGPIAVLKLLSGREMYGYELVDALDKTSNGVLAMGQSTLYPLLYNLEAKGFIEGFWRESSSGRGRKYYRLTRSGKQRLSKDTRQWAALVKTMSAMDIVRPLGPREVPT